MKPVFPSQPDLSPAQAASPAVQTILDHVLSGGELAEADAVTLFRTQGADKTALYAAADTIRRQRCGDQVGFVVNRNINFTNICYMSCRFCGFGKRAGETGAEFLSLAELVARAREAWDRGATEVCIQGGLHPKMSGEHYRNIIAAIKSALPDMHIHAFSPFEIWFGAAKLKMSYHDFLSDLRVAGLGSMPGTAAEILDIEIRSQLSKNKLSAETWVEIIRTAHEAGIRTTATIMYGHIDGPEHWAAHIALLRQIQKQTGGFTELVPLSFIYSEAPLYQQAPDRVRPGPTDDEIDKMHAVSRLMLAGWIDNIQVSWPKLGAVRAAEILSRGANDIGGTLMNESIARAAGAAHGQEITAYELVQVIRAAGRTPVRRNTLYQLLERYDDHDPPAISPLIARAGHDPVEFLKMFPLPDKPPHTVSQDQEAAE
jgi:7,8-didemethyl-8-hydroxy-5-deazariboflavin synthase CofH subunit